MKRLIAPTLLLLFLAAVAADEMSEIYRQVYKSAEGIQQKNSAVQEIVKLESPDAAPVMTEALKDLLRTMANYRSPTEQELFARTVRLLATAIGERRYAPAARLLWTVVEQVPQALARSEALIALGKVGDASYAGRIALLLRDLNMRPTPDAGAGESVAYGAILALSALRDPAGYPPVFFASQGWYSQRVRQEAERALPLIAADPSDAIEAILAEETPERMVKALRQERASSAPPERKAMTALLALWLGRSKAAKDTAEERELGELRKLALVMVVETGDRRPESVPDLAAAYEGANEEERLLALRALGANGSEAAAAALSDIIRRLDVDQRAGLGSETRDRLARAAIEAAAQTRRTAVLGALVLVATNDAWSGSVIQAAKRAQAALR